MADFDDKPRLSDDDLRAEFAALFPHGWAGPDVLAELAPAGWAAAPLAAVFHPSAEQVYEEAVRSRRNMDRFPRRPDAPPLPPEPTLEQVRADHRDGPVEPERECQELVGRCLWDVFSDNHEVTAADGRLVDLGSMRASGGFLADVLNAQGGPAPVPRPPELDEMMEKLFPPVPSDDPKVAAFVAQMREEMLGDGGYTYLDFYMGTLGVSTRADLVPVYAMIFRRLRGRGMGWAYVFPRIYAVRVRAPEAEGGEPEWAGYDPGVALEKEEAERRQDEELADLREKLDEGHREAVTAARDAEPPATVRAYHAVYGHFPRGWPPEA